MPNHVTFYKHPVLLGKLSQEKGREIYEDRNYIEIQVPGQKNQIVKREVQDKDKVEYPAEWNAYDDGTDAVVGSPIDHLPGMTPSKEKELQALGIYTIEQLAALDEPGIQKVGHGARDLIKRGEVFLGKNTEIDQIKRQNEELAEHNRDLTAKVDMLMKAMEDKPKRRGRPPAKAK